MGFARMGLGRGARPERAKAARRLMAACHGQPFYVRGHRPRLHHADATRARPDLRQDRRRGRLPAAAIPEKAATASRSNARTAPTAAPKP